MNYYSDSLTPDQINDMLNEMLFMLEFDSNQTAINDIGHVVIFSKLLEPPEDVRFVIEKDLAKEILKDKAQRANSIWN